MNFYWPLREALDQKRKPYGPQDAMIERSNWHYLQSDMSLRIDTESLIK